ncbi:hypothetical protein [Streptomyces bullii]|uniref:Glycosyl hydrolase family 12 n=1 Tax=Streptomyces bullii TaxID=349910 RepID=A0ABW0UWZ7_9ACTN
MAASRTYWFKHYATGGNASTWYSNDNFWGVNSSTGTGFVAMVNRKDWGCTSPVTTLPKKSRDISPNHTTWFSQSAYPKSGSYYEATYDIFIDPYPAPTDCNSKTELMIWRRLPCASPPRTPPCRDTGPTAHLLPPGGCVVPCGH